MAVVLITGRPGAGKTLSAVKMLIDESLPSGRLVYADIDGLEFDKLGVKRLHNRASCPAAILEWVPEEVKRDPGEDRPGQSAAENWWQLPEGSCIYLDECQRVFPVRNPASRVPVHVSEFETHRHKGYDVFLITQGPRLIDRHIHDLVDRHVHLYRAFGLARSTRYEWNGINTSPDPEQGKDNASKANFSFPAKYFSFYKSASVHTVKKRIPWAPILMLAGSVPVFAFLMFFIFGRLTGGAEASPQIEGREVVLIGEGHSEQAPDPSLVTCAVRLHSLTPSGRLYQDLKSGRLFDPDKRFRRDQTEQGQYLVRLSDEKLFLIC